MHTLRPCRLALTLTCLTWLLAPTIAHAQAGFYVTPSLGVAEVYDDNIFYTSTNRVTDFITRFSPGIETGYKSDPLTLLGRYTFDAEVYAKNPQLTTAVARQAASLDFRYLPARQTTLSLKGGYFYTTTPAELNVTTGLQTGRALAQEATVNPSLDYQFDARTRGIAGYTFTFSNEVGDGATDQQEMALSLQRVITPLDTASLNYTLDYWSFSEGGTETANSLTLGWTRTQARTTIALRAGARLSGGVVRPTGSLSIDYTLEQGLVSLTYSNSLNSNIGQVGTTITNAFGAAVRYQPVRALQLGASAGYFINTQGGSETKTLQVGVDGTYQINSWLSLVGSYQYTLQRGTLGFTPGPTSPGTGDIPHNVVLLRLVATYPYRVY